MEKSKILKYLVIIQFLILLIVLYLLVSKKFEFQSDDKKCIPCSISNKDDNILTYSPKLYYTNNDRNVFTVISSNKYITGDFIPFKEKELLEYDEDIFNLLDQYKDELSFIKTLEDGSNLYHNSNNEILFCNSEDNRDIYFFYDKLNNTDNLCNSNESETFIQTYQILNIVDGSGLMQLKNYFYVTLRKIDEEEIYTACINKDLFSELSVGNYYEFTFRYTDNKIETNPDFYNRPSLHSIFKNTNLIRINEVDKNIDQYRNTNIRYDKLKFI